MKTIEEIADIVELQTWAGGEPATLSALVERLEAAFDEDDLPQTEEIAQKVMDEFLSRHQLLHAAYPFKIDGSKLELDHPSPASTTYLFCLGMSLLPPSEIHNEQRAVQFESVVMNAAQGFFGGRAIRIGAPWHSEDVPDYSSLLDRVIELIPNLGKKLRTTAPDGGDAGWDVIVVKNFCDNTFPRFIVLGNCATGRTDWLKKGLETQPTFLWSFFQSEHRSVLIRFLAVPFVMTESDRLKKLSDADLTLDRFRICEFAPTTPVAATAAWLEGQREQALQIPIN